MIDTSDQALADLLDRLKSSADPHEINRLSSEAEKLIFHKQTPNPTVKPGLLFGDNKSESITSM
jgi:hypothetical protein